MKALRRLAADIALEAQSFDADVVSSDAAVEAVRLCTQIERAAHAMRVLATQRVDATSVASRTGHRDTAEWVARESGISYQQAAAEVDTARRLVNAPDTKMALQNGELSLTQASLVSKVAVQAPHLEAQALIQAKTSTAQALRVSCRRMETESADDDRRQAGFLRRRRYFRTWTETDGCIRVDGRLAPEDGARLVALVEKRREGLSKAASRSGCQEPQYALRADALMLVLEGNGKVRATVNVTVDHAALVSDHKLSDETCRIDGVGEVPVATAKALLDDALMKVLVLKDGDVTAVRSAGRYVPAMLDTALKYRDVVCAVPFCDSAFRMERDHRIERSVGGEVSYENLDRLCKEHHAMKTHKGFRLVGTRGDYRWCGPGDDPP